MMPHWLRRNTGLMFVAAMGIGLGGVVYAVPDVQFEILAFLSRAGSSNACESCRLRLAPEYSVASPLDAWPTVRRLDDEQLEVIRGEELTTHGPDANDAGIAEALGSEPTRR